MTTTILTDEQIRDIALANGCNPDLDDGALVSRLCCAIEQAVLQSITNDADRINAAAKALSKHMDYPWEFMAAKGRDSMRTAAMVTINAAKEKQP